MIIIIVCCQRGYVKYLPRYEEYNGSQEVIDYLPQEPIDVVYSWVNGNDPARQKEVEKYRPSSLKKGSASVNRWRDNDELKYSIRSVRLYAPWVRNIYIITSFNQRPEWLKDDTTIKIINDTEIVPSQYLPTFNSLVIEACAHRIPGLSERYLYLCDDFFFGNTVELSDFISPSGKRKVFFSKYAYEGEPHPTDDSFTAGIKYTNQILEMNKKTGTGRYISLHTPRIHSKLEDREKINLFPKEFHLTLQSKFRDVENIHDNTLFDSYYGLYQNTAEESTISHAFAGIGDSDFLVRCQLRRIERLKPKTFCLNDEVETNMRVLDEIKGFLHHYFPEKGTDEK